MTTPAPDTVVVQVGATVDVVDVGYAPAMPSVSLTGGDIGGTAGVPTVVSTHLASPLPITQGGTGAATGAAALTALGGVGLASPAFTGTPTAPTQTAGDNTTKIATDAFVVTALGGAPTDWFNVKSAAYGATGNGSTDDTTAIQAAATALVSAGAGCLYFPPGTYKTSSPISITNIGNGIAVRGTGTGSRIQANGSFDVFDIGSGSSENGLVFENLYISCTVGGGGTAGSAISLNDVSDFRISGISTFSTWNGIYIQGTAVGRTASIYGCYISTKNWGLYTQAGISAIASQFSGASIGAVLDSCGGAVRMVGVSLYGPLSLTTRNSLSVGNPNKGLWLIDTEANYESGTNPAEGPGGFNLDWCAGEMHLDHCWLSGAGITFGGNTTPTLVNITGGTYSGASYALPNAINMKAGTQITLTGAQIQGADTSSDDAILISSSVTKFTVSSCQFSGSSNYNINSAATGGPNIITGNAFSGNSQAAPVNYPSGSASAYTITGNSGGLSQDYLGIFGDGSDGAAALNGTNTFSWCSLAGSTYTMSRDCFCTSLTISSAVTLAPNGYRIFVRGTVTNGGTITVAGASATSSSGGGGGNSGAFQGGQGGGAGNTGVGSNGNIGGCGVGCGGGGAGGAGTSGTGGTASGSRGNVAVYRSPQVVLSGMPVAFTNSSVQVPVGTPSGGGGGGDGTNHGGGGGGGAGIIAILAWAIVNNGTFTASGGNGFTPTAGTCGGGGGGGGGVVVGYTLSPWTAGTINVAGGNAGSGFGTGGVAGTAGGSGSSLNVIVQ